MIFFEKIKQSPRLFNGISWGVTALIVLALLGFTFLRIFPVTAQPARDATPTSEQSDATPLPGDEVSPDESGGIVRHIALKTSIDENVRYDVEEYVVERGDTVSSIADDYGIESNSLMWSNDELMLNGPNSLKVGQVLLIPPVDGVLYQWQEGDMLAEVADAFKVNADDILLWPGNEIDLSDPTIEQGAYVMIPGGKSDAIQYISVAYSTGGSGTYAGSSTVCGNEGPIGGGGTLLYPSPYHYINGGNQYGPTHLAIDLYAPEGTPIYAADSGIVVWSSYGAWNGGYGNVVMIDHRNGFKTLYAHLSVVYAGLCQWVYAGEAVGLSGNTGNSFGAHLHFEVRLGGGYLNPWDYLPPP